jgi:hypothetical protein
LNFALRTWPEIPGCCRLPVLAEQCFSKLQITADRIQYVLPGQITAARTEGVAEIASRT